MKRIMKNISILLLLGYVAMGLFLYIYQRDFLYFPTPELSTPYTEMLLQNEGESLKIIVLNKGHKNAILYFGGNAESMAQSSDYIAQQFPEFTVYLMNYRGYGGSTGSSSEEGLYSDALKLYDTIALITPFDSIVNVAQGMYPIYPVSFLLHDQYDSLSRIKKIRAKTFIIIAQNDRVITSERTQQLIDAFDPAQLKVTMIKNRGHMDISSDARYYKIMQEFIGEG